MITYSRIWSSDNAAAVDRSANLHSSEEDNGVVSLAERRFQAFHNRLLVANYL